MEAHLPSLNVLVFPLGDFLAVAPNHGGDDQSEEKKKPLERPQKDHPGTLTISMLTAWSWSFFSGFFASTLARTT